MFQDGARDFFGEYLAIHGKSLPARHPRRRGRAQRQRIQPAQLFFQKPRCGGVLVALERITANELGKTVGLMRRRAHYRPHLAQNYGDAALGELKRCLGSGQPAADYMSLHWVLRVPRDLCFPPYR